MKKDKPMLFVSPKHYKNFKLRIFLWLIGYKAVKDFFLDDKTTLFFNKTPQFGYIDSPYKKQSNKLGKLPHFKVVYVGE